MTIVNNSLFNQMQSMTVEAMGSPKSSTNNVNQSSNSFGDLLANALESVTDLQKVAGKNTSDFIRGESQLTLAEVMISRSKAGIASEATLQVRNKALEGYKEIMSMPV
ncbi:flagellar hook-basal body complex protein FliE [Colwellia ponticola]|uniref:Flagellar hook-basal body complex protein FliE n=1 Tax=Colwellia ponticola TaxID=2304625 RepID=A0A8H2JK19_9GAMM|nr:flagellar hook-basal body complex protein FliE [Colwellia ponticola]TMM42394.1 flagellar hook-basal body complex protein FliE [Colwellia ponticola]